MIRRPPRSTLFPYPPLFRSEPAWNAEIARLVAVLPHSGQGGGGASKLWSSSKRARQDSQAKADRKSTRLNSSHANISYAVFCLKKKKKRLHNYNIEMSQLAI